ncbi:MAG: YfiR family protein [bacterium]|nr:YfiR family protein [bacterium]
MPTALPTPRARLRFAPLLGVLAIALSPTGVPREAAPAEVTSPAKVAYDAKQKEYALKAAFLFHFAKHTAWPKKSLPKDTSPIYVTVVGRDPFGKVLDSVLRGKKVDDHALIIRRYANVAAIRDAHLIVAGHLSAKERDKLVAHCRARAIFLIGDQPGLAARGALASFYLKKGKVRFEMNRWAIDASGLKISSQVLKLARFVQERR